MSRQVGLLRFFGHRFFSTGVFSSPFSNLTPRRKGASPLFQQSQQPVLGCAEARVGQLRVLLQHHCRARPLRMLETHNGLTGLIAENVCVTLPNGDVAEFDGLWSSSLTAATSQGMPDIEVVDTSARLNLVRETLRTTSKPLIYDGDTGGHPAIFQYTVRSLESMGVSACIIEDKSGLKQNSLFGTTRTQLLEDIDVFCKKIRSGQEAKKNPDFMVIARLEALIAGAGQEECLRRAVAYVHAGADGIMIHSKAKQPDEVIQFLDNYFMELGSAAVPVVAVPSTYNASTEEELGKAGVSIVIYANHMLRAAYPAMVNVASSILLNQRSLEADNDLIPIQQCLALVEPDSSSQGLNGKSNKVNNKLYLALNGNQNGQMNGLNGNQTSLNGHKPPSGVKRAAASAAETFVSVNGNAEVCPDQALREFQAAGVQFFCGVPDSLLAPFCQAVHNCAQDSKDRTAQHLITANEGAAVATAAGYFLATGTVPVVYLQNSGIGNAVNPLLSLAHRDVYGCPMVLMVGWRGQPGASDEPQHQVQGRLMLKMLESMELETFMLPNQDGIAYKVLRRAVRVARDMSRPVVVLVPPKTFRKSASSQRFVPNASSSTKLPLDMKREEALAMILTNGVGLDDAVVATTGFTSRELFEFREMSSSVNKKGKDSVTRSQDFLTVGSMGHALAIAQGIALAQPTRTVWCLDGDGAALMHMGSMAALGALGGLPNLKHVLLNNGVHDSVGGQPVCGNGSLDFVLLAQAAGYGIARSAATRTELTEALSEMAFSGYSERASFLEVKLQLGTRKELGRPKATPVQAKEAFMEFLRKDISS
eukprot:gb/GEZN01001864.1/.p1 GENE.gb/GEZN01001864.1/~~gb/GEZN01001864.1/.p1  ORF type:complete len:820 (+),score=97.54 gb/GEZN01001864.1/:27-2486(+)